MKVEMTDEQFWSLIERSRSGAEDCDEQAENLSALLDKMPVEQVVDFAARWGEKMHAAYRWDIWAVAYIVNGGCSDDAFIDFRGWMIAGGQNFFHAVLDSPERAAEQVQEGEEGEEVGCEEILYCAPTVFEKKTGQFLHEHPAWASLPEHPEEPTGQRWSDEDLPSLYPALCARFDASGS